MDENTDDKLRKLLKKVDLDAPSALFTERVMQKVEEEAAYSEAVTPHIKSLLQQHGMAAPSPDFTANIMAQIAPPKRVYAPIIPRFVGYMAAAFVGIVLLLGIIFSEKNSSETVPRGVKMISIDVSKLTSAIPDPLLLGAMAVCVLLLVDYSLRFRVVNPT